jgi:prolyl-tRNA editing enzyme YbaK/EbsC (Cys-tRNA(Pro) deacylase)
MLTAKELQQTITTQQIAARIVFLAEETPTVASAAATLGITADGIGKSVLFWVDAQPWLIIANGLRFIDHKKLADHLGVSRRRTKLASADEVLAITGFAVGTVPPFGHKTALPTLIDHHVLSLNELYAGGGDINALIHLSTAELLRVVPAEVVQLTKD